ncbi:MAG: hypothetical protein WBM13_05505 [Bacteroidia bacterium]
MKNQENIKISIPNICNEDWNTMKPNEKGAFCEKCCKTVIDFTTKSTQEITELIKNSANKTFVVVFYQTKLMSHNMA